MNDKQLVTTPADNKSTMLTVDYLVERAKRGSKIKFDAVMAKVPDIEPLEYDRIV